MSTTNTSGLTGATDTPDGASGLPHTATGRRGLLHGLPWLVCRRHRTFLRLALLVTVVGCATFAYQRIGVMDFLHTRGTTPDPDGRLANDFQNAYGSVFLSGSQLLEYLPVLIGIFVGAPLIAGEQEHGTIKLVTTQSVSRGRWIAATLALPLAVAVLCTTLLSAVFTWLWTPAHKLAMGSDWLAGGPFDSTGPVPVAKTLFLTACGIAIGMLIKRVVPAIAATAVFTVVTGVLWAEQVRPRLGALRSVTYPYASDDGPRLPVDAVRVDDWVSTADGTLYGFGTCVNGDAEACRAKLGIVNRVTQYFDYGQMAGMQWRGAGILLALTVVVLAFVVWRAHRRPL
ncbi:ABC transporter permease [Streptomyces sp. NEAU-S7GS2]|uniref:ABC transporter permease n=1 Tax=Streptomyces sp. NEAU-S7GS2 TaxID=2202000 RepID=UPI000D6EFEE5|nr:ABC transporter permease [Streptomyces sp. NEAU-S7GS2]AWN27715.1 ABC transporter permease [Streptomyces sp. NEAU-S7GS2]